MACLYCVYFATDTFWLAIPVVCCRYIAAKALFIANLLNWTELLWFCFFVQIQFSSVALYSPWLELTHFTKLWSPFVAFIYSITFIAYFFACDIFFSFYRWVNPSFHPVQCTQRNGRSWRNDHFYFCVLAVASAAFVASNGIALYEKPISELRSVTCQMGTHMLPVARHRWTPPRLNPSRTGWALIYLPQRDGRLSWPRCWLYTEMVYLSANNHPSKLSVLFVTYFLVYVALDGNPALVVWLLGMLLLLVGVMQHLLLMHKTVM